MFRNTGIRNPVSIALMLLTVALPCQADTLKLPEPVESTIPAPESAEQVTNTDIPSQPETAVMPDNKATTQPAKAPETISVNMPGRGMSMEQVRLQFGEPNQIVDAIGEPPITRWLYDQYTIYFEHTHVIHAVARQSP